MKKTREREKHKMETEQFKYQQSNNKGKSNPNEKNLGGRNEGKKQLDLFDRRSDAHC
ncbi:hypothetical protein SESBI_10906 [Sesbania bispinosa]|nr:hypothetical protein SESBI_16336 [Sesbania bispinosa]KAJ1425558.1 hypothetical protein SESBI_10906 [Sesbania bispinosa]